MNIQTMTEKWFKFQITLYGWLYSYSESLYVLEDFIILVLEFDTV